MQDTHCIDLIPIGTEDSRGIPNRITSERNRMFLEQLRDVDDRIVLEPHRYAVRAGLYEIVHVRVVSTSTGPVAADTPKIRPPRAQPVEYSLWRAVGQRWDGA